MRRVDFLIAGFPRCGTTSFFWNLTKHSKIAVPAKPFRPELKEKELGLFTRRYERFKEALESAQTNRKSGQLFGDATPCYMRAKEVPERVFKHNRWCKIIVLYRDPLRAVHSYFTLRARRGDTREQIQDFDIYVRRYLKDDGIFDTYRYINHINRWFKFFPREQFLFIPSDVYYAMPSFQLSRAISFLDLEEEDLTPNPHPPAHQPTFTPETKDKLLKYYEETNKQLALRLNIFL